MFLALMVLATCTLGECSPPANATTRHAEGSKTLAHARAHHSICNEKPPQKSTVQRKGGEKSKRADAVPKRNGKFNPQALSVLSVPLLDIRVMEKIVNGEDALPGQFPYMVSLRYKPYSEHFCGGTLVSTRHVLTAAHCVIEVDDPAKIYAVTGTLSSVEGGNKHSAEDIRVHEDYVGSENYWLHDVAIVRLSEPVVFDENQSAVDVADTDAKSGTLCTVSGWGYMRPWHKTPSTLLQSLQQVVVDQTECRRVYTNIANIAQNHVCGFWGRGYGACGGDSGGPLVCDGKQQGIVSFSSGCDHGYPSVYTRVAHYHDWIMNMISEEEIETTPTTEFPEL